MAKRRPPVTAAAAFVGQWEPANAGDGVCTSRAEAEETWVNGGDWAEDEGRA